MLVMLLGALDQTIMAPALPAVAAELGGLDRMPAVVTAYLAAATVVMPLYGKLGDRFGRGRCCSSRSECSCWAPRCAD